MPNDLRSVRLRNHYQNTTGEKWKRGIATLEQSDSSPRTHRCFLICRQQAIIAFMENRSLFYAGMEKHKTFSNGEVVDEVMAIRLPFAQIFEQV